MICLNILFTFYSVALARAVYAVRKLVLEGHIVFTEKCLKPTKYVLLDDPLSAVVS